MKQQLDELQIYGKDGLFHKIVGLSKIFAGRYFPVTIGGEVNENNLGTWLDEQKPTWPGVICFPPVSQIVDVQKNTAREVYAFRLFFLTRDGLTGENETKFPDPVTGITSHTIIDDMADMKNLAVQFFQALDMFFRNSRGKLGFIDPTSQIQVDRVRRLASANLNGVSLSFRVGNFLPCTFEDIDVTVLDATLVDDVPDHLVHFH